MSKSKLLSPPLKIDRHIVKIPIGKQTKFCVTLSCPDNSTLIVDGVKFVVKDDDFTIQERNNGESEQKNGCRLTKKTPLQFYIIGKKDDIGFHPLPIALEYRLDDPENEKVHDVFDFIVQVEESDDDDDSSDEIETYESVSEPSRGPKPEDKAQKKVERLREALKPFSPSQDILNLDKEGSLIRWEYLQGESISNYVVKFAALIFYEEIQLEYVIRTFDLKSVTLTIDSGGLVMIEVPGLAEKRPSVLKRDKVVATVAADSGLVYMGEVRDVKEKHILVKFPVDLKSKISNDCKFDIHFCFNRVPYEYMLTSLKKVASKNCQRFWRKFLFPQPYQVSSEFCDAGTSFKILPRKIDNAEKKLKFFNSSVEENYEQNIAVQKILDGGVPGMPYIIFGPPGTGKTTTVVEAILQVWSSNDASTILASASSNAAADVIALRLLETVPSSQIFRLYALSFAKSRCPSQLLPVSNFNPTKACESVNNYRIVVVTFCTAGRLSSKFSLPKNHFSHVFVDEAGHAVEPETLNAITLAAEDGGQVVIAGDPKQLGPVISSPRAVEHGLQVSILERLMERQVYKKNEKTGKYNNNLITKLIQNFRSHQAILHVPSKLFYDSELIPRADESTKNFFINWPHLPNPKFPIVFHGVVGEDGRYPKSTSYCNKEEALVVTDYLKKLLVHERGNLKSYSVAPEEIAIISPYRGQISLIKSKIRSLKRNYPSVRWSDLTIGSTEELQGQERKVVIITTVRSQLEDLDVDFKHNLGFLQNPKRYNVVLTRAQALIVAIGNPTLLCVDSNWKAFIDYVIKSGGYRGCHEPELSSQGVKTFSSRLGDLGFTRNISFFSVEKVENESEKLSIERILQKLCEISLSLKNPHSG